MLVLRSRAPADDKISIKEAGISNSPSRKVKDYKSKAEKSFENSTEISSDYTITGSTYTHKDNNSGMSNNHTKITPLKYQANHKPSHHKKRTQKQSHDVFDQPHWRKQSPAWSISKPTLANGYDLGKRIKGNDEAIPRHDSLIRSDSRSNGSSTLYQPSSSSIKNKSGVLSTTLGSYSHTKRYSNGESRTTSKSGIKLVLAQEAKLPHTISPAESYHIPGYINTDNLPFEIGSMVINPSDGTKYKLINVLGEGSYAVVYLARDLTKNTTFALKCLSCHDMTEKQKEMQISEVNFHKAVSGHDGIVKVYNSFTYEEWLFIVMERITGSDLYDYIMQHPTFGMSGNREEHHFFEALRFFEQMLEAVSYVHSHKIYHRDLKPENFIIDANGNLKLTDFGLSTKEVASTNFECGSKPYMSYENRNGGLDQQDSTIFGYSEDYSPRLSDIWALGVLLLNLLFAESPWQDPSVDSCFRFCDFLRDGSRYLCNQFPKLPKEIADFLVARVFCPERKRCSVLELKQWAKSLTSPSGPYGSLNQTSTRTAKGVSAIAIPQSSYANSNGKNRNDRYHPNTNRNSPHQHVYNNRNNAKPKYNVGNDHGIHAHNKNVSRTPEFEKQIGSPVPKHADYIPIKDICICTPQNPDISNHFNLSTSVPAHVFSQYISVTKAAAALQAMPRDCNGAIAKTAAAALRARNDTECGNYPFDTCLSEVSETQPPAINIQAQKIGNNYQQYQLSSSCVPTAKIFHSKMIGPDKLNVGNETGHGFNNSESESSYRSSVKTDETKYSYHSNNSPNYRLFNNSGSYKDNSNPKDTGIYLNQKNFGNAYIPNRENFLYGSKSPLGSEYEQHSYKHENKNRDIGKGLSNPLDKVSKSFCTPGNGIMNKGGNHGVGYSHQNSSQPPTSSYLRHQSWRPSQPALEEALHSSNGFSWADDFDDNTHESTLPVNSHEKTRLYVKGNKSITKMWQDGNKKNTHASYERSYNDKGSYSDETVFPMEISSLRISSPINYNRDNDYQVDVFEME
ncbi:hypothetical protein BB558_000283 [Smittium angustum]|uniref:non-specific serine/threonine protein kinase n=1 Tax=Smittium angustum TaxID=133377 RepID=A0A2U1JEK2_SMIAN|nr:hypothetical protein BB558_000283 [Smittium angustum]